MTPEIELPHIPSTVLRRADIPLALRLATVQKLAGPPAATGIAREHGTNVSYRSGPFPTGNRGFNDFHMDYRLD
jgi:hypothetical protein